MNEINTILTPINHLLFSDEINTINDLKTKINLIFINGGCTQEQHQQIIDAYELERYKDNTKIGINKALQLIWNTYKNDYITLFDYTFTLVIYASCNPQMCQRINTEFENHNIKWRDVMQNAVINNNKFN